MKIHEALAPVAAAALLAGCGSSGHSAAKNFEAASNAPAKTPPTRVNPADKWTADMEKSLNNYRNDVLLRHRARIALGMCVAWPTRLTDGEGGTAVTLNPGVVESEGEEYYVFSTHLPQYTPSWGPLNGPSFLSPDAEVVIMTENHVIDAKTERKLSKTEEHDASGQRYFEDTISHEPVIDTALLPGELSASGLCRTTRS